MLDASTKLQRYLLSPHLRQILERHSAVFPTKRGMQHYVKSVLRSRFSSDFYSDARNGRPTQYQFLCNLLLYLRDKEHQFISIHLQEDWQSLTPEQLAKLHICDAPEDYTLAPRSSDTFKLGPTKLAAELFSRIHGDGNCRPAKPSDIEPLVQQFAIGVGDSFNLDFLPPANEANDEGFQRSGLSPEQVGMMLDNAIQYCSNSVWIRHDETHPERMLLSMLAPVRLLHYQMFREGRIDEAELFTLPPCQHSNHIVLIAMLGHARQASWLVKHKAKADLMFMLWRQIGLVSNDVMQNGLNLLTFESTDQNSKRLASWGFAPTGTRMKRTDLPLVEMRLTTRDNQGDSTAHRYIWPLTIVYQTLGQNRPV